MLQSLTRDGRAWDDPLTEEQRTAWEQRRRDIPGISDVKIRHCFKSDSSKVRDTSIHCFADASEVGDGAAIYVRTVYINGRIDVALTIGKSRVAAVQENYDSTTRTG